MAEKKKRGFLSKLGFKSKADKLAEEAAARAEKQKLIDEQMAARMAAINAAALKAAREQDEKAKQLSAEEEAAQLAEEQRLAEIQAARDVARAKQLAEEQARKTEIEAARQKAEAEAELEAQRLAEERAAREAEAKRASEKAAAERAAEEARLKAEAEAAQAKAASEAEAAELKAQAELEAKARAEAEAARLAEEARLKAEAEDHAAEEARQIEAARQAALEKAEADRLKAEAVEAERRARIAEERAARDLKEREILEAKRAEEAAKAQEEAGAAPEPEPLKSGNFFDRITGGLRKSTNRMSQSVSAAFTKRQLDDAALEELEDILVASDLGLPTAMKVTDRLREDKFDKQVSDLDIKIALAETISEILTPLERPLVLGLNKPQVLLFVGVNGSGKTTTLGKIAKRFTDDGKKVLIAAGDTFRAAAVEQLTVWGERAGAPVMSAGAGADASGLVWDAMERAKIEDYDILMIDTAGRLQNRTELMDELEKIIRVIRKQDPSAPHHSVLVLDATVGQNALTQTEAFHKTADVTGLIMTKLDGTAKGGVLVALSDKFNLPIHYIGIGERIEDLESFSAPVFSAAISGVADAMTERLT